MHVHVAHGASRAWVLRFAYVGIDDGYAERNVQNARDDQQDDTDREYASILVFSEKHGPLLSAAMIINKKYIFLRLTKKTSFFFFAYEFWVYAY